MAGKAGVPSAPKGAGTSGRALWRDVLGKYELEEHELALLREAVRTVGDLDGLAAVVARDGLTIGGRGHPAWGGARQLRIGLARLVAAFRLPSGVGVVQPAGRRR